MLLGGISLVRAAPLAAPAVLEITEFPVPRGSGPHDVAPAIDGGVWCTAQRSGELGWLNPATGETRHVALGRAGERSAPHGVVVGPDGAPWITDFGANALVRFDPSSESFEVLPHAAPGANVRQLLGRPGEVWGLPRARTAWSSSTPASYRASVISRPVRADS